MAAILTALFSFILTGVIGNRLIQSWQARNWLWQQLILGREKEYILLKELADEIATLSANRLDCMRAVTEAIGNEEKFKEAWSEYNSSMRKWNERLGSFLARLPILASFDHALSLENKVQTRFVDAGKKLEKVYRLKDTNTNDYKVIKSHIRDNLTELHAAILNFNKELLNYIMSKRGDLYFGTPLRFTPSNLELCSNWQLFKALFIRDIDAHTIPRPLLKL